MDVNNLKQVYPILISYLEEKGYRLNYIRSFKSEIKKILQTGMDLEIDSYDDYYKSYLSKGLSKKALARKRQIIGAIKQFDYQGKYPSRAHPYRLLQENRYDALSPDFKKVVSLWESHIRESKLKESSISTKKETFILFLCHLTSSGARTFDEVNEGMVLNYFFCDGVYLRGHMTCSRLKRIMKECDSFFPNGKHKRIYQYIPTIRNIKKIYPCLTGEETAKIMSALERGFSGLNCRDRAIGLLALLCGLRACDIAALKINDINWKKELLCIVQQKTDIPLKLPFCPLVGNAIYDYIMYERPKATGINHVFLIDDREVREISHRINHVCKKIMVAAGLSSSREKIGFHLFRHRFGVMLLDGGISAPVISAALGHISPDSLNAYLDSDLMRLKRCGISIEKIPIGKEVFK